jgi:Mor family transcriptional regulator
MKPMEARRNELLADVAAHAAATAQELGVPADQAEQIGAAVADALAANWGGQTLSFPKDAAFRLSQREQEILAAHRAGTPVPRLAQVYRMSEQGLRKLLRRAELRGGSLNQIDLFDQAS